MSLKKFEIQEMIAKGGMAEVYRAKTVGLKGFEKEVCVKKILPHLTEDESFVTMFINEAKLAATLSYANIVSVHDLCISAGNEYFIVMEFVQGKDLSDVIRAAQLEGQEVPQEIAVAIVREVCKGLHYAHTKTDGSGAPLNIIHRDVSPHNVLVSFMGEVKITDFGIAKASSIMNKTAVGILKGKYGYMSPEQARGQPLDLRSDIFNTGIVLYELLVGERCFAGSSDFSTLNLMRNASVTPPTKINTKISKDLEAIVLKALSLEKNERYKDALELESALAKWAERSGKRIGAAELASFMQGLFSAKKDLANGSGQTGVLSLSSVVGPPPEGPPEEEEKPKPRRATERAAELADAPLKEAPKPAPEPKKDRTAQLTKDDRKSERSAAPKPEPPKEARPEPPKAEAKKEEEPKAEAKPAEEPKPERKPAKVKAEARPDGEEKKKGGKQKSDAPKKPVGRQHLRPGLTMIARMQEPRGRRGLLGISLFLLLVMGAGAGIGHWQTRGISHESTFRQMEINNREAAPAKKPTVTVVITSEPPGAQVRFDKIELSERTPMAVERERDALEHTVELVLPEERRVERTFKYGSGPVTRVSAELPGAEGSLKLTSRPAELPVRLGERTLGKTPLEVKLPAGKHELLIGGGDYEEVKTTALVEPGKTTTLNRRVPPKGTLASLTITAHPPALVVVDDEATGRWTSEGPLALEPDVEHKLGLLVGEKPPREIVVRLKRGESKQLVLDLAGS